MTAEGRLLDSVQASEAGYEHLSDWMRSVEAAWDLNGKGKRTFVNQLDYIGQLSSQFPAAPVRVLYAKAGALPAAIIIRDARAIIDHKLYWSPVPNEKAAYYLTTILNSETARARAERYQSRGQFGARNFDKVMFNLPIPVFDPVDKLHQRLASAGARAERVAEMVELVEGEKFQRARRRVREALAEQGVGAEIEGLVATLLGPAIVD